MGEKGQLSLRVECQLISIEEMMKIENHHEANITVMIVTGKNHKQMLVGKKER